MYTACPECNPWKQDTCAEAGFFLGYANTKGILAKVYMPQTGGIVESRDVRVFKCNTIEHT